MTPISLKHRLQFGLGSLLLLVALCATGTAIWRATRRPPDVRSVSNGLTRQEVLSLFGPPEVTTYSPKVSGESWAYPIISGGSRVGAVWVTFEGGKVISTLEIAGAGNMYDHYFGGLPEAR